MKYLSILLVVSLLAGVASGATNRPNVVVVVADDMGGIAGKPVERQIPLFWHTHVSQPGDRVAMRIGDWKIVGDETLTRFHLYEVQKDWKEENDLAASMPAKLKEMKTTLLKLWADIEAEGPSETSSEKGRRLRNSE